MTTKRRQREGLERSKTRQAGPAYVLPFRELTLDSIAQVGGKNASLGELLRSLTPRGVAVPDRFAVMAAAFHLHLAEAGLDSAI
jgi:pyruvate,water dikinase